MPDYETVEGAIGRCDNILTEKQKIESAMLHLSDPFPLCPLGKAINDQFLNGIMLHTYNVLKAVSRKKQLGHFKRTKKKKKFLRVFYHLKKQSARLFIYGR